MSKTKKIAILAIIAMVLTMMPASLFAVDFDGDRLAGDNRIETALAIADAGWDEADVVVLAPADQANLVDALAAAPLAGQENAPILLTFKGALNADVKAAIADLGASKVYAVGAISDEVVAEVEAIDGVEVEKLSGADRWATAEAINAELDDPAGTFVVGYNAVADAMSVASYAAANGCAIVLANADGSVDEDALVGDVTYIVGGKKLVKDIEGAERIAGDDRFETNADVAEALDFDYDVVYVANGLSLVDALAVAPLAAQDNAFVLLASANDVESIDGISASTQVIAVGGTSAVPNKVLDKVYAVDEDEFTVKSAKAINLIQIELQLSNDNYYDKDELEDVDNYDFEGIVDDDQEELDVIDVDVDGASAVLTLGVLDTDPSTTGNQSVEVAVDNQTEGTLTIDKKVTGEELVFEGIEFEDFDIPVIEDAEVIGEDTVKIYFSEPMNLYRVDGSYDVEDEFEFELDGKSYSVDTVTSVKHGLEANVSVFGKFTEGELTVEVGNGLEDYAGFGAKSTSFEIEVVEDTEAPEVIGYKDADTDEVTLIFNEDIRSASSRIDNSDFYHTNDDETPDTVTIDGDELELIFSDSNSMSEGTAYIYIKAGAVEDFWGNENDFMKVKVEIEEDEEAPTVEKVKIDADEKTVEITFSEHLDEDSAEDEDNYSVVDEDGDDVVFRNAVYEEDGDEGVVTLNLKDTPEDGIYTVTVEGVKDVVGNKMEEYSEEVEVEDSTAPREDEIDVYLDNLTTLKDASGNVTGLDTEDDDWDIIVQFPEAMAVDGKYSVADLYKYEIVNGSDVINLGEAEEDDDLDATIKVTDNDKVVKIYISDWDYSNADGLDLRLARVADADGNITAVSLDLGTFGFGNSIDLIDRVTGIMIEKAVAKDVDTIKVKFDGNIDEYEVDDFIVKNGSTELEIDDIDPIDADEAYFYMEDDLPYDTSNVVIETADSKIGTENSFGLKLAAGVVFGDDPSEEVEDEIAPEVVADDEDVVDTDLIFSAQTGLDSADNKDDDVQRVYATFDGTNSVIAIEFTETIDSVSKHYIDVTVGGDELEVSGTSLDSRDGLTNNTLIITVVGEVFRGTDIDITGISDDSGNLTRDLNLEIEYEVDRL